MQIQDFNATNIPPQQMSGKHPSGMFPFQITNTRIESTKDNTGGMFVVTFTTPAGTIENRYNLWNPSAKAVEIAQKELSALCHATGVFKLTMSPDNLPMAGHELRGARGVIKVRDQPGNEKYSEVEMVYDANGNEPGKTGGPAPAPQPQGNWGSQGGSAGANANGSWNNQQPQQQPANTGGWQQGPTQQQPTQQQQPQGGQGASPPWAQGR